MKHITLITGGQRSGKSRFAEEMALRLSPSPVYIATAHVWDNEFKQRIEKHKMRRGTQWTTIEEELSISKHCLENHVVVIDCITLWCTNFFYLHTKDQLTDDTTTQALEAIKTEFDRLIAQNAHFIFVTNEIGCGEVSTNPVQRRFTDMQGWFNQYVANQANEVFMMISGIPLKVK